MTAPDLVKGMEEAGDDTEAVLAAYRERKRRSLEDGLAPAAAPAAPMTPPPTPGPPATLPPSPPPLPPSPQPTSPAPDPGLPPWPDAPLSSSTALEVPRPAPLVSAPGATLSPLGPVLRLSDALLKDVKVSVKGSPRLRAVGIVLLLLGLALVAVDRRQVANGAPSTILLAAGAGLALLGVALALAGLWFPPHRRLAVRLAASQQDEWRRIQGETQRLTTAWRVGLALSVGGMLVVVAGYALPSVPVWAAGALATVAGLALLVTAQVRRSMARRLYVQTMVLSGLEAAGLGGTAPDGRVQPVILALDGLLGALPEAEVQRFLATPQAKAYLELVDEAMRSQRGG